MKAGKKVGVVDQREKQKSRQRDPTVRINAKNNGERDSVDKAARQTCIPIALRIAYARPWRSLDASHTHSLMHACTNDARVWEH